MFCHRSRFLNTSNNIHKRVLLLAYRLFPSNSCTFGMENPVRPLRAVAVAGLTGFDYWDWDVFGRVGPTPALDVAQHSASRVLSRRKNEKEKGRLGKKATAARERPIPCKNATAQLWLELPSTVEVPKSSILNPRLFLFRPAPPMGPCSCQNFLLMPELVGWW